MALNRKCLDDVLNLFTPDAMVCAPIFGRMNARDFHVRLLKRNRQTIARLKNVFYGLSNASAVALHFAYTWTRHNGKIVVVDGIVIFEVCESSRRFSHLTIIYDPSELRRYFPEQEIESISLG